jgi:hypothetical protein
MTKKIDVVSNMATPTPRSYTQEERDALGRGILAAAQHVEDGVAFALVAVRVLEGGQLSSVVELLFHPSVGESQHPLLQHIVEETMEMWVAGLRETRE